MANETNGGKLILETTSDQLNIQTIQFIYPSSATKGKQIEHKNFLTDLHFFTFLFIQVYFSKKKFPRRNFVLHDPTWWWATHIYSYGELPSVRRA